MGDNSSASAQASSGEAPAAADGDPASGEDAGGDDAPGHHAAGRLLVASNRGPLSFAMAPDGSLSARRGCPRWPSSPRCCGSAPR
jgi:hypothetical protein